MRLLRNLITLVLLVIVKLASKTFFTVRLRWIGSPPEDPWADIRVTAILNHTSLFEPIFAAGIPLRFAWRIARHAVVPVADITIQRPVVGRFFRLIAGHVIPITRKRDHTWKEMLAKVDDAQAMVVILPEGRMMRKNGLDSQGRPMTVRGGIADILREIPEGRMILAYSQGLHHVQAPGEKLPRLFQKVHMKLENLDLAEYRDSLIEAHGDRGFRQAVIDDLTRRRDLHCPGGSNHPDAED